MNNGYLKKIAGIFLLIFAFCSAAEAGPSASRVYKIGVTVPALFYVKAQTEGSAEIQNQAMQVAMEKDVRDNQIVMVKTVIAK